MKRTSKPPPLPRPVPPSPSSGRSGGVPRYEPPLGAPGNVEDPEPATKLVSSQAIARARAGEPAAPEPVPRHLRTGPVTPVGLRAAPNAGMPTESELRNRILSGLSGQYPAAPPPPSHVPAPPSGAGGALPGAWGSAPSGSYPAVNTTSGGPPGTGRYEPAKETVPIGYVVASALFLAIAVIGFGLWLALEVISL